MFTVAEFEFANTKPVYWGWLRDIYLTGPHPQFYNFDGLWMDVGWLMNRQSNLPHHVENHLKNHVQHLSTYIYILYVYVYYVYIYYVYVYVYHLGFRTSCTVTVCNNHPKYSGSMFHPIHPSAAEELPAPHGASLHGRVAGAFAARSAAPSLRGELGTRRFDPGTKVVGSTKTSFYQQKWGGTNWQIGTLMRNDMMIWDESFGPKKVVFCQPNSRVNQRKVELTWTNAEIEAPWIWIQPALSWLIPQEKGKPLEDRQEQQQTLNCSKCSF